MDLSIPAQITDTLASGAAAAGSGLATTVVNDLYTALKSVIVNRFKRPATINALEEDPSSATQKSAVTEVLLKTGAADDPEVQDLARQLAAELAGLDSSAASAMGLDIDGLQAGSARFANIASAGTAVRIRNTTVAGHFEAEGIRSGQVPDEKN